jgi:hypothetical protein
LTVGLASLAAMLTAVAVVEPRSGRWTWTGAALALAVWIGVAIAVAPGAIVAAGLVVAAVGEGKAEAPTRDFLGLVRRLGIVVAGLAFALLFTERALEPALGADAQVVALTASAATAAMLAVAGAPRERHQSARYLLTLAGLAVMAVTRSNKVGDAALVATCGLLIALLSRSGGGVREL